MAHIRLYGCSATRTFRGVETQTIDALDKIVNERFASANSASLAYALCSACFESINAMPHHSRSLVQ
jgi:hypothetical protein